ncbi:hypothetical protein [Solidesulfovibrio sp.]
MGVRLIVVLGLVLALAGCASQGGGGRADGEKPPVMTVLDYYEYCSSLPTPDSCISDPICNRFRRELSNPPADLQACLTMCRKTGDALYTDNLINGCAGVLDRAVAFCDQFCRRRDPS